jgi:hypothetical protein
LAFDAIIRPSFFGEESENHGHEAQNLPFGRIFPKSSKLAPVLPLMPSIGMLGCQDSENGGLEAQNLYLGRGLPKSPKLAPFCVLMPAIGTSWLWRFRQSCSRAAGSRQIGSKIGRARPGSNQEKRQNQRHGNESRLQKAARPLPHKEADMGWVEKKTLPSHCRKKRYTLHSSTPPAGRNYSTRGTSRSKSKFWRNPLSRTRILKNSKKPMCSMFLFLIFLKVKSQKYLEKNNCGQIVLSAVFAQTLFFVCSNQQKTKAKQVKQLKAWFGGGNFLKIAFFKHCSCSLFENNETN